MLTAHGCSVSEERPPAGPRIRALPILVLNIHSQCNCRCVMCDIWKREERTEIKAAALERHRASLQQLGVRWVVLSGGEPLLHSDLGSVCSFFRELDIRLTLLTTGLLLAKRAGDVAEWFDDVIVSLDGPAAIHDSIRNVNGAYKLIGSGISAIRERNAEIKISARTTVQKANHAHLRETVEAVKTLGMSSISFLAADLTSEAFNRPLIWPVERQNSIALTREQISVLANEVDSLIADYRPEIASGYIAERPAKLRRIVQHFQAHLGLAEHQAPRCNAPWVSAVIEPDGSLRPCFFHPAIGNIRHADLDDALNSDTARAFRGALNVADNPICRQCVCSLNFTPSGVDDSHGAPHG